jgi:hypothetical protein
VNEQPGHASAQAANQVISDDESARTRKGIPLATIRCPVLTAC